MDATEKYRKNKVKRLAARAIQTEDREEKLRLAQIIAASSGGAIAEDGGPGSGNWGHKGREGKRGGSTKGGGVANRQGSSQSGYTSTAKQKAAEKGSSASQKESENGNSASQKAAKKSSSAPQKRGIGYTKSSVKVSKTTDIADAEQPTAAKTLNWNNCAKAVDSALKSMDGIEFWEGGYSPDDSGMSCSYDKNISNLDTAKTLSNSLRKAGYCTDINDEDSKKKGNYYEVYVYNPKNYEEKWKSSTKYAVVEIGHETLYDEDLDEDVWSEDQRNISVSMVY
ncbi:MAG: hypothetical protein LUD12_10280 [Lachnospiraceae bacterium]|nr:hypothetical protein [Lachnospiraceae bacterium]